MTKCLIVDDDKLSRLILKQLIKIDDSLELVAECTDAEEAFKSIESQAIDVLFLDIEMPGMSGIELVKGLGTQTPYIVFISAKKEYAADAFDLSVVDFLVKPVTPDRFLKSILKIKELIRNKTEVVFAQKKDEFIFIRDGHVIRRLKLNDIGYLEAKGDKVKIFTQDKVYSIHSSLKGVEEKLPTDVFLRVHRSFIINVGKIDLVEGSTLIIQNSFVPVSDAYKAILTKRMQIL
ncbi:LytR/AlgR family response regulator transcription factor [Pedobacter sp. MW01-1-1]|uniref:LytR/AlgR family response regulator transcription factor n=1 Tax=Pedobacter sp. MW01-1-1 TaxID=3383027 RepID=UPI003FEDA9DB